MGGVIVQASTDEMGEVASAMKGEMKDTMKDKMGEMGK